MSSKRVIGLLALGIVAAAVVVGISIFREDPAMSPLSSSTPEVEVPRGETKGETLPSPVTPPRDTVDKKPERGELKDDDNFPDEAALMAKLRELKWHDPPLSLRLAREGNVRYPDSPDAPERTWFMVKALSDMGRHDEARAEARVMVDKDPDNDYARDVRRHMLIHPPGPPPR